MLRAADPELEAELRGLLARDDDYRQPGKPTCDYDDPDAREQLVDALAKDAHALLLGLDGREPGAAVIEAARVLAAVVGQDLDEGEDGVFRIARRVAKDRIISTVDPQARHGHKTSTRGFDGYKGHVAVDPDSELITATTVTAGNVGDAAAAEDLLADELPDPDPAIEDDSDAEDSPAIEDDPAIEDSPAAEDERLVVYGDSAYGAGVVLERLEQAGADIVCKVQPPAAPAGRFAKDEFAIDLEAATVTCPAGQVERATHAHRRADRALRRGVRGLPAGRALHRLTERAHDPRDRPRGAAPARTPTTNRPGLDR